MATRALLALLVLTFVSFPAFADDAAAGGPRLITEALTVERIDGDPVYLFTRFQVTEYEGYSVEGATGRYDATKEILFATGDATSKVRIAKEGEERFTITASKSLEVHFSRESLWAEGEVEYRSEETAARSERLLVDEWQRLHEVVAELLAALPAGEAKALVDEFFAGLEPAERLLLLLGSVEVEREETRLWADWVAFAEGDERFVSAGGERPIELQFSIER